MNPKLLCLLYLTLPSTAWCMEKSTPMLMTRLLSPSAKQQQLPPTQPLVRTLSPLVLNPDESDVCATGDRYQRALVGATLGTTTPPTSPCSASREGSEAGSQSPLMSPLSPRARSIPKDSCPDIALLTQHREISNERRRDGCLILSASQIANEQIFGASGTVLTQKIQNNIKAEILLMQENQNEETALREQLRAQAQEEKEKKEKP